MNTLLIIGATSTMASNCARLWVTDSKKNFEKVVLVARNKEKLSVIANDLKARSANKIEIKELYADFSDENSVIQLCDEIKQEEGEFTTVLIAHGVLSDNTKCRDNYHLISSSITVNSTSVAILLESIVAKMNKDQNKSNIGVIGSVAGDRGRASNYIYGATKGFDEKYVEGLHIVYSFVLQFSTYSYPFHRSFKAFLSIISCIRIPHSENLYFHCFDIQIDYILASSVFDTQR